MINSSPPTDHVKTVAGTWVKFVQAEVRTAPGSTAGRLVGAFHSQVANQMVTRSGFHLGGVLLPNLW